MTCILFHLLAMPTELTPSSVITGAGSATTGMPPSAFPSPLAPFHHCEALSLILRERVLPAYNLLKEKEGYQCTIKGRAVSVLNRKKRETKRE